MGTDPWFALRALGFSILLILTAGIPTLALAQPDQLEWKENNWNFGNIQILYLTGTTITLEGLRRIYRALTENKGRLSPEDLASMPAQGENLGEALYTWLNYIIGSTGTQYNNQIRLHSKRITPNTGFQLPVAQRESLVRLLMEIQSQLENTEKLHKGDLGRLLDIQSDIRRICAADDTIDIDDLLNDIDEKLILARHCLNQYRTWWPEETNFEGEYVWTKIYSEYERLKDLADTNFLTGEEEERTRWEDALKTALPKAYHQNRPKNTSQYPIIPATWASAVNAVIEASDAAAQKVRDQVAALAQQVTAWEQIGRTTHYNGNIVDPNTAAPIIAKWKARADYAPIFTWMKIAAGVQDTILSGQQLKDAMEASMVAWLEQTNDTIPSKYRDTTSTDFADRLQNSIDRLKKGINRMTTKGMSGVTPSDTYVPERDADLLRNAISPKYFPKSGPLNYDDLLRAFEQLNKERIDALTTGKNPMPGPAPCRHPEEAAVALHQDPNSVSWADSIDEMTRLYNLAQQQPGNRADDDDGDKLFRASEVPEFKERKDYWSFRSSLNRFISGVMVRDRDRLLALNRILSRFTGREVSDAANRWNVTNLALNALTWPEAYIAFRKELDRRFLSPDFATQQEIRFRGLRVKDMEPQEFINEFETRLRTLEEALDLAEMTPIENGEVMRQLMSVLPGDIRAKVKDEFRHPEEQEFFTIAPDIIRWWMNINAAKPKEQRRRSQGGSRASTNPSSSNNSGSSTRPSHPVWGPCNKPCWDEETIVPQGNRGIYMNIQRGRDNICPRCRRGQSEHGGHPTGCQHPGAHHWHNKNNTASRSADPSGNDTGDS